MFSDLSSITAFSGNLFTDQNPNPAHQIAVITKDNLASIPAPITNARHNTSSMDDPMYPNA